MVSNKVRLLCAFFIFPIVLFCMYVVTTYFFSLVLLKNEITFSAGVFIVFFSFPFVLCGLIGATYFMLTQRKPKYYDQFIKVFGVIALVSLILSVPVSSYVNFKLKNDGYLVCNKISWMSPTTYVKNLSLCK
ncbi:DUF1240 domain-containing protein [Xenorhabdus griffiniae]|nr:DUF1240 domain-containing protein [Xenorhabdus griffiniae]MBD1229486.1 DUF1240 domain-containing protein [Xenorhabdus griffiniae]MBE8589311.1 DUF1240 domain-containing protein [Xenorhabdus griffiniae]